MKTGKKLNAKKWACRKLFDSASDDSSDGKIFCEKRTKKRLFGVKILEKLENFGFDEQFRKYGFINHVQ